MNVFKVGPKWKCFNDYLLISFLLHWHWWESIFGPSESMADKWTTQPNVPLSFSYRFVAVYLYKHASVKFISNLFCFVFFAFNRLLSTKNVLCENAVAAVVVKWCGDFVTENASNSVQEFRFWLSRRSSDLVLELQQSQSQRKFYKVSRILKSQDHRRRKH